MRLIVNFSLEWSWACHNRRTLYVLIALLEWSIKKQRRVIPLIPEINRNVCLSIYLSFYLSTNEVGNSPNVKVPYSLDFLLCLNRIHTRDPGSQQNCVSPHASYLPLAFLPSPLPFVCFERAVLHSAARGRVSGMSSRFSCNYTK